jgi:glycosyltransferase involved in cell wall biosynthesis
MKEKTILFIKPGSGLKNQIWAIHHYAAECARKPSLRVVFLSDNAEISDNKAVDVLSGYPPLPGLARLLPVYVKRLYKLIVNYRRLRPDIIHINNHIGAFSCLLFSRLFSRHAAVILDIRTLPDNKIKFLYYRLITKFFDWVFYLNQEILTKMVRNRKHSILPLGFDPEVFTSSPAVFKFSDQLPLKCLYYGSLEIRRKLDILIEGFQLAIKAGIPVELTIIGEGNGRKFLKNKVNDLGLQADIHFSRQVTQAEIVKYIRRHHIGISFVPSDPLYDCQLPLKAVEMLACGLPVLATNTTGNKEVVQHLFNGFIVEDDRNGIYRGLEWISKKGIPDAIYENASASVYHLTWSEIVSRYLMRTYSCLLKQPELSR